MEPVTDEAAASDDAAESQEAAGAAAESPAAESQEAAAPDTESPAAESPAAESPAAESPAADDSGEAADTPAPSAGGPRGRLPVLLGGLAVVLAAFAIVAAVQAHSRRSDQASNNVALTNAAATSQVKRQVTNAIDTIFSYSYTDTAATRAAAQRLLTGPAVGEYDKLFKLVEQDAPKQHLVLTTKVTNIGVELLVGDRARLLIFADQRDTQKTTSETTYAGAMFAVNAVRQGGRWKIENIDTFTGSS